jgi:hypothetical protein
MPVASGYPRWAAEVTIQDVGSIGELIAAIATVATLAYLAFQIRSNTIAMKAEARRGARIDASAVTRLIAGSGETAELLRKGLAVATHIARLLSSPGVRWYWRIHRGEYPAKLQEYFDSRIPDVDQGAVAERAVRSTT